MKRLSEDWIIVILGLLIIFIFAAGLAIASPVLQFENVEELASKVLSLTNLGLLLFQFLAIAGLLCMANLPAGKPLGSIFPAFPVIFIITTIAQIVAGSAFFRAINIEGVLISLFAGLAISNGPGTPEWLKQGLATEFYVKIGLVLLGSSIIFGDIMKAGALGLIQAVAVVLAVWYFSYWLCKKFKIDQEMRMMLSSAVSICGVSAAIATAGAIEGDSKKLSYVITLVLITAIPMMIGMPYLALWMGLSQEVTGAWLGGTIDTTGAVVASGTLVGETALKVSTIVKFSQNVLLGVAALLISLSWSYSKASKSNSPGQKNISWIVVWQRFPKFVLGFVAASLLFSFVFDAQTIAQIKAPLKSMQNTWFALAFTCIGLETRLKDLFSFDNRKPLFAFLLAQLFNILFTLVIAFLLFGNTSIR